MSEKVILTQEQADFIEQAIKLVGKKSIIVDEFARSPHSFGTGRNPVREFSVGKLADVLFNGYEVEKPKFQVGDKVVNVYSNKFNTGERILSVVSMNGEEYSVELSNGLYYVENALLHATPEEIYWLYELGRDKVLDIKIGDYVVFGDGETLYIHDKSTMSAAVNLYSEEIKGIYPAESFKPLPK